MTKRLFKVTILFCIIISLFVIPSFALGSVDDLLGDYVPLRSALRSSNNNIDFSNQPFSDTYFNAFSFNYGGSARDCYFYTDDSNKKAYIFSYGSTSINYYIVSDESFTVYERNTYNMNSVYNHPLNHQDSRYGLYFHNGVNNSLNYVNINIPVYTDLDEAFDDIYEAINTPAINKNPNVDEFIANTLISMGIRYSQYSDALSIASSAWNYIIDENNWYIGSGDRNDKDIIWDIDNAASYANAQSNNYLDWYNGYKVNKDLTIALTKFISDNYIVSTLGQGTLAGYNVYYNGSYSYGTVGGTSGSGGTFGSSPNALSFYPASTITYFNGAYLHDNNIIDQDEFVYSPADVRKFIGYPSSAGIIDPPTSSNGTGVVTDGNGDTIYNIDLDWPSFDWLAEAIQAVLDFLDRLITTIADFLTQILDAILSLFSDAFESLTEFGEGIIEWLYAIIAGFSTIGSNYIPASLWAVILPFILINIGVGLIMFVMRSH